MMTYFLFSSSVACILIYLNGSFFLAAFFAFAAKTMPEQLAVQEVDLLLLVKGTLRDFLEDNLLNFC